MRACTYGFRGVDLRYCFALATASASSLTTMSITPFAVCTPIGPMSVGLHTPEHTVECCACECACMWITLKHAHAQIALQTAHMMRAYTSANNMHAAQVHTTHADLLITRAAFTHMHAPSPPPSIIAGPPMPMLHPWVAMMTSHKPNTTALPAHQNNVDGRKR